MPARGRSPDVSPIALVRVTLEPCKPPTELAVNITLPPHDDPAVVIRAAHLPTARLQPRNRYLAAEQPIASSSRLDPLPQLSPSHSSSVASSLEQTPTPSTPLMHTNDVYFTQCDNELLLDYYDSPPSPPRTLQDQMQVAYAMDNMHLAKMLLLKLKGIEVTDDQDPRIAQVKDEDFAETFVPRGGLQMTEEAEQRCKEGQRRENERRRRLAREERLRACERIWENGTKSYREAKVKAASRKEAESRVRRLADWEARERDRERTRGRETAHDVSKSRKTMRTTCGVPRPILSYNALPASQSRQMSSSRSPPLQAAPVYEYTLMRTTTPASSVPPSQSRPKPSSPNTAYRELTALLSTHVPFSDVLSSMQGALFHDDDVTPCRRGKSLAEMKLLETLLEPAPWEIQDVELMKGKARARMDENCVACAQEYNPEVSSSSSSSSAITFTRSVSWFSFSSRSTSSTTATTPSTSPMSVKVFQPLPRAGRDMSRRPVKHSCRRPHLRRLSSVPLHSSENPLAPAVIKRPSEEQKLELPGISRGRSISRSLIPSQSRLSSTDSTMFAAGSAFVARMSRSVTTIIDMATQLQRAYVKATLYTANPDIYFTSDYSAISRSRSRSSSRTRTHSRTRSDVSRRERGSLLPQGYRASCDDVLTFTSVNQSSLTAASERPLIPLASTGPGSSSVTDAPRVFPAPLAVPRSPFRPAHPPPCLTSRLRPIANPLLLRLRALHNLYGGAEKDVLEVREKVVGVAWEGIGRSSLVWEVKSASL
ncbi:hypothetical protein BDY19DRAFT_988361 [Irpex rosettiformis]|uniref:Uncharacterized protein n=1 Tax=Irpex rosettiformis TaxID=378272 RepID=A0ACB8UK76_9APHY|nr:hypothetical protein BDY19DRAFT_988361 [Irpex rosettiformis]